MQHDRDRKVSDLLERALRHAHLRALDFDSLLAERLDDVEVGHRTEQPPVDAGLLRNLNP